MEYKIGLLRWIEGFLIGRSMAVSVVCAISSDREVTSGVPRSSVLKPFLVYANYIACQ